jgi:hypothetical protein
MVGDYHLEELLDIYLHFRINGLELVSELNRWILRYSNHLLYLLTNCERNTSAPGNSKNLSQTPWSSGFVTPELPLLPLIMLVRGPG